MKTVLAFLLCLTIINTTVGQSPKREFRGLWVTTIHNLDWPSKAGLSTEAQKKEFISILDRAKENGINALIVQIRPQSDAIYESQLEPWSYWLTEKPGQAPQPYYDPLEFMIEECQKRCIEFHAWFNLFRGVSHTKFSMITDNHITNQHPEWFYEFGKSLFLDPGIPEAKNYLIKVVTDVVDRYDIDGVHLDDYFYPIESKKDRRNKIDDKNTYNKHKGDFKNIEDWRRYNNNILIKQMNDSIKKHKAWVKFGVAPFPVWRHKWDYKLGSETNRTSATYDHYYADTRKWIEAGWVDYLAPQMYWGTQFERIKYKTITSWWNENAFDRHIYIGHAFYKLTDTTGEASNDPSWQNKYEINDQIKFARTQPNIFGGAFYRANSFNNKSRPFEKLLRDSLYQKPALVPTMSWIDSIPPPAPQNAEYYVVPSEDDDEHNTQSEAILKWDPPAEIDGVQDASYYIIYAIPVKNALNFDNTNYIVAVQKENYIHLLSDKYKDCVFIIRSVDRSHNESKSFIGVFPN